MQEALAAEQAEKLKELAYSEDSETEDSDQNVIPEKPIIRKDNIKCRGLLVKNPASIAAINEIKDRIWTL